MQTLVMKTLLSLLLSFFIILQVDAQTIYMVRHGEKSSAEGVDLKNPPLSDKGLNRAKDLQKTLADKNIEVIYVTSTIRSNLSAAEVAKAKNLKPTVYHPMPDLKWIQSVIDSKIDVLIVAHSNTISHIYNLILEAVGKDKKDFEHPEDSYNVLYMFDWNKSKVMQMKEITYGENN